MSQSQLLHASSPRGSLLTFKRPCKIHYLHSFPSTSPPDDRPSAILCDSVFLNFIWFYNHFNSGKQISYIFYFCFQCMLLCHKSQIQHVSCRVQLLTMEQQLRDMFSHKFVNAVLKVPCYSTFFFSLLALSASFSNDILYLIWIIVVKYIDVSW